MMKAAVLFSAIAFAGADEVSKPHHHHHHLRAPRRPVVALVGTSASVWAKANPASHFPKLHPEVDEVMSGMDTAFAKLDQKKQIADVQRGPVEEMVIKEVRLENRGVMLQDGIQMDHSKIIADDKMIKKIEANMATVDKAHENALEKLKKNYRLVLAESRLEKGKKAVEKLKKQYEEAKAKKEDAEVSYDELEKLEEASKEAGKALEKAQKDYESARLKYRNAKNKAFSDEENFVSASAKMTAAAAKLNQRTARMKAEQASVDQMEAAEKKEKEQIDKKYEDITKQFQQKKDAVTKDKEEAEKSLEQGKADIEDAEKQMEEHEKEMKKKRDVFDKATQEFTRQRDNVLNAAGQQIAEAAGANYIKSNDWAWRAFMQKQAKEKKTHTEK